MVAPSSYQRFCKQRRKNQKYGRPYPFLRLEHGKGTVWAGEEAIGDSKKRKIVQVALSN
jgi:hypothetical protein